jgi:hypothetical protein
MPDEALEKSELELLKLKNEISALTIANANLKRPFWKQTSFWLAAVPATFAAVISALNFHQNTLSDAAQYQKSKLQDEISAKQALLDTLLESLRGQDAIKVEKQQELDWLTSRVESEQRSLRSANRQFGELRDFYQCASRYQFFADVDLFRMFVAKSVSDDLNLSSLNDYLISGNMGYLTSAERNNALEALNYLQRASRRSLNGWPVSFANALLLEANVKSRADSLIDDYKSALAWPDGFHARWGDIPIPSVLSIRTVINTAERDLEAQSGPLSEWFLEDIRSATKAAIPPEDSLWVLGSGPFDSTNYASQTERVDWWSSGLTEEQMREGLSTILDTAQAHRRTEEYVVKSWQDSRRFCQWTE